MSLPTLYLSKLSLDCRFPVLNISQPFLDPVTYTLTTLCLLNHIYLLIVLSQYPKLLLFSHSFINTVKPIFNGNLLLWKNSLGTDWLASIITCIKWKPVFCGNVNKLVLLLFFLWSTSISYLPHSLPAPYMTLLSADFGMIFQLYELGEYSVKILKKNM